MTKKMGGFPTTLVAALGGYLFTYYNSKLSKEREALIDFLNEQVRELYGPLLACVTASRSAYEAMVREHSPDGSQGTFVSSLRANPQGSVGKAYRQWMKEVLQPLNEKAAGIVVERADLLEANAMDPLLMQLVAHVFANRVILHRWQAGDLTAHSSIPYPNQLGEWVEKEFRKMKCKQALMLGMKNGLTLSKL